MNGNTSEYYYDAAGVKRKAVYMTALEPMAVPLGDFSQGFDASVYDVSESSCTDYCGNFIYENGLLKKVLTPEGYLEPTTYYSRPDATKPGVYKTCMTHNFFLRDHLGNTRVQLKQYINYKDISAFYLEDTKDYYAFGLEHGRLWEQYFGTAPSTTNPYLYNGKEMDRMHGLNQLDYGARWYDASLGRWGTNDPLAEKYSSVSSYMYCLNNPLRFVDLKGEEPTVYEAALMAKHVYGDKVDLVGGWSKSYNINTKSGLQSAVYQRTTDGVTEYAYVSAGTQMTDWRDIKEDAGQIFGNVKQYKESVKIAEKLAKVDFKDSELTFVGHSLGGGLAAANALKTGKNAITFNPAALTDATKDVLGLPDKGNGSIFNVVVKGEALDHVQSNLGLKPESGKYELKASYFGARNLILLQRIRNHSIDVVIKKLVEENER